MKFLVFALALMALFSTASACTEPTGDGSANSVGQLLATYKPDSCDADNLPSMGCCTKLNTLPALMSSPLAAAVKDTDTVGLVCPCSCASTSCPAASVSTCTEPSDATKVGGLFAMYKKDACNADQLPAAGCCTKLVDMPKVMSSPLKGAVTDSDTVKDVCPCTCADQACTAASCVEPAGAPGSAGAMIASVKPDACDELANYCHVALDSIEQLNPIPADIRAGVYVYDICPCTCGTSSGTTTANPSGSTISTVSTTANPVVISGSCTAGHDVCATLLDCTLPVGQKKSANLGECTIDGNESQKVTCVQDGTIELMFYSDQTCTTLTQTMEIVKAPSSCINNVMADWDGLCGGNDTADYPSSVSSLATLFAVTLLALFMI